MPFLSFALAAALALTLAGCAGPNPFSRMSEPNMTPLSPKLQKLFEKTKPVCFGRFIIDVPVTTEVAWGPSEIGDSIVTYPNQAHKVKAEIDARLAHYAKEKHRTAPSMLVAVRDGPHPGSKIIVGYDSRLDTYRVHIDAYFPLGPHAFVVNTSASTRNLQWESVVSRITEVASRLRVRKEEEIPTEPGICIEGGFIAKGERKYYERISIGFRILPDVHFSILGMAKSEAVASDRLEEAERRVEKARRAAIAMGLGEEYAKIRWLRKGRRPFAGQEAFEAGGRYPESRGHAHEFRLEAPGEPKNPLKPTWDIEMDTGAVGDKPGQTAPSLTDEEAVALWDRLLASIRPRPGAMAPGWVPPSGR